MANIVASNDTSILKIKSFLGLNENPDGRTVLKVGELSEMRNFRITQDGHLQIRPGTKALTKLQTVPRLRSGTPGLHGVWYGMVNKINHTLVAFGGHIYAVNISKDSETTFVDVGTCTEDETTFFGFGNKVYMLNGHEYMSWDGNTEHTFEEVTGYIPTISTSTEPTGEGHSYEGRNLLNGSAKIEFNGNGTAKIFVLGEKNIDSVDEVKIGDTIQPGTAYTVDLVEGKVTFTTAPATGENNVIITYTKEANSKRSVVESMHYSELFNGNTDSRIFLYGDNTNKAIYSGVDVKTTEGTAEYFPELYEIQVGEKNTPITSLVRHYSRLMAYKPNSTYQIYGQINTLSDGNTTIEYFVTPVNRQFGNEAMGQVKLLENNPVSVDSGAALQWKAYTINSSYSSNEQNAERISDKVVKTLGRFELSKVKMNNLKFDKEYWIMYENSALIYNYSNKSWYYYDKLPFEHVEEIENEKYGFANDGTIYWITREATYDENILKANVDPATWEESPYGGEDGIFRIEYDGSKWHIKGQEVYLLDVGILIQGIPRIYDQIIIERKTEGLEIKFDVATHSAIDAYAATGSMDFDRDWLLKYSPYVFVATQPESNSRLTVAIETNKRSDYPQKVVAYSLATFRHLNFAHLSFATNRKPQVRRLKIKVKKATYYKIIYKSNSTSATATVLETDVKLRYANEVK